MKDLLHDHANQWTNRMGARIARLAERGRQRLASGAMQATIWRDMGDSVPRDELRARLLVCRVSMKTSGMYFLVFISYSICLRDSALKRPSTSIWASPTTLWARISCTERILEWRRWAIRGNKSGVVTMSLSGSKRSFRPHISFHFFLLLTAKFGLFAVRIKKISLSKRL